MILADPIKEMTMILEKALDAEVEVIGNLFSVKKFRTLVIQSDDAKFSFEMGCDITFQTMLQSKMTINKAEILLLPSELSVFLSALISQVNPLPNNYSQRLVVELSVYCLYLETQELPEPFAKRLAASLKAIDGLPFPSEQPFCFSLPWTCAKANEQ
ncbi:hypothetical protein A1A1_08114 [Planococcus antarcticus DSM 14505]|uniref:Uncharacterized protein n=1 Tax=Planococcus antarcticus DSM 14505 TaxID=1185653 RepID=A0A1C7DHB8_9BACL|nr:hypothetical protein [Planococcus antarcticus]ANU10959.1 hypothetical protein BBH88_11895 [Planococcus antarcticus DSM 14505]EIM07121.1 hypothetical protein A1A1_08114 [Planococcus antarcticus DSM 14505]